MTSLARDAPKLDRIILGLAGFAMVMALAMFSFWETRQQDAMDRLIEIQSMQAAQLATLQEMVRTNRRDIEKEGR